MAADSRRWPPAAGHRIVLAGIFSHESVHDRHLYRIGRLWLRRMLRFAPGTLNGYLERTSLLAKLHEVFYSDSEKGYPTLSKF